MPANLSFSGSDELCPLRGAALAAKTLSVNVKPTSQKPMALEPRNWGAGTGDPRFAPSPAAGCEQPHKSSAVLIPFRLWFFFLFPLSCVSPGGSGVASPAAGSAAGAGLPGQPGGLLAAEVLT